MLKIESDTVQKDSTDVRLEIEELSAIEEDVNSIRSSLYAQVDLKN